MYKLKFVFQRVQNFVGKGGNAGYQHFLHFLQCFLKIPSWGGGGLIKTRDCVVKGEKVWIICESKSKTMHDTIYLCHAL